MKQLFTQLLMLFISIFSIVSALAQTTYYVNDASTVADVYTTAVGNNSNVGTAAAPFATLQHAVTTAAAYDIIYVDAGNYAEQVIINKGISIIGAGQFLTFFSPPATTLIPAPGPFTEIGLFETTQGIGDVHISNLFINSNNASQNIIIQGGGSVTNCILANGFQGIFFRVESGAKTALIENNSIQPVGIGINCQGSGLTALIRNNRIIGPPNSYYAGIFAGLDFGPLPQLTIQNNIIENFNGEGIVATSFNGTYTLNSIIGTGTNAINRQGNGGNTPIATCNWFGTSNAATVASKIVGTVIYTPFLTDGTDNSSNVGFQPNAGACATGTLYYVNDGINTGDIFTTAPGNDGNAGTAAAPFGTLQHAVNTAAANDIIYVDAGTYTEQVTITKGINIIGAGQNVTSILKPAVTVAPPGPFTEQGVIQTAQNIGDVNIKDISVTGDFTVGVTPLIIQSGGSVRNCKLQGGNQGLFVRIDAATNPGAKIFYIEGNTIQAEYIAVNTVGTSLHAILSNNTIAAFNAGFSSGMWAGMDFGPLGRLTATNNLFSTYSSSGIQISASNASITQNAFTGTGAQAINRTGGANITATCNWYGTANAAAIVPKITPGVNYYPWYVDGTDANPVAGFQHYSESCGGGLNILYVNDNNTTGDLFTTTIGNDANAGTPTSPLATFGAALIRATPGTVIYMDAGTYTAQDATIDKQVQVIGTNFNASPNSAADPLLLNSTRNAETIIENTNWIIGANSIYLDGLTFNPLGKQAITLNNTTWGDTRLLRNRLRISSNLTQLNFTGSGTPAMAPSAIANWNLNIRENRFEKEDAAFGTTLVVSRYGGVNIMYNSFVVTGTTVRFQIAINAGSSGVVNYLNIANNTFDRASTAINSSRLAIANMNFNKFINTSNAFNGSNALAESSEVGFRYNILDGSGGILPFIQYNRSGGNAVGATSSFTAEENTITGTAVAGTTTLLGSMNLIFFNTVLNPSLTVRNNKITIGGDLSTVAAHFIRPIMIRGNLANAVVEKNEINLTGINQQPRTTGVDNPVSPAITLYTDNGTTSFLQSGSVVNIFNNKINGFKHSFAAYDDRAGNDAFVGFGNIPAGVTVNINNNSFTGDSISINNGTVGQPVLATCNWYGSADAAVVIPKISGIATYSPWLSNGTDNEVATGFQPVPNSCNGRQNKFYVNDASQTGDVFTTAVGNDANSGIPSAPLATIKEAINRALTGDEIYVDAGTYVENIIINKSVTLIGAKFGQNPGSILDRGGESIIIPAIQTLGLAGTIIQPAADNITIDGLLLDGDNPALTTGAIINGADVNIGCGIYNNNIVAAYLTVKNTIVKNVQSYGIGLFRSLGNQNGPAVPGNLFTQNRVDNVGTRGIVLGYNAYGNITNNYISRCGTSGTWFSQQRVANVNNTVSFISENIIENCNLGMQSSSLETAATTVQYINNELLNNNTLNSIGISLLINNASGVVLSNNKISGYANGVYINATNATAPVLVNNNSITSFANFAIQVVSNNPVNATCNWYGSAAIQNFINKITSNTAQVFPYLTIGTDIDAATGFQPVPNSCDGYPTLITLEAATNVTCNGAVNGTINITTSYGKAPFTYTWTKDGDANFVSNEEDPTGLAPGIYHLAIADANGSNIYITDPEADGPGTVVVTITEPDILSATTTGDNNVCFNGTIGSASVTAEGGTTPYTYLWSNGATAEEIYNLAAGIYNVTVTDANGCITTAPYEVTQPTQVTASITNGSSACSNIATVNAGGGTPAYTYLWSNGSTSATISGVPVGTYTVTVTDANGCTATVSVTLTVAEAFNPSAAVTNVTCFAANNGIITVTNANGAAPFMFSKDGGVTFGSGTFPYSFTNLAPGTYNIAVKDANGCTGFVERIVTQPTQLTATVNSIQNTCFGQSTGAVNVSVAGGVAAYTYSWTKNGGGFSSSQLNISAVAAGNYTLMVTDKNGCTAIVPVTVPSNNEIVVNAQITNVLCRNTATGAVNLTVSGGTGSGFTYAWSGAIVSANEDLNNIGAANNYNVRITDIGSGCFVDRSYQVTQPAALTLSTTGTKATGCNSLGTITATPNGGVGNYQYSINGGTYQASNLFTGLYAGTYTIALRDGNGCITTAQRTIDDTGGDEYESNNGRAQSKPIAIGSTINARLALANDAADWFVITTPAGGGLVLYSLSITHPTPGINYTFHMYPASPNNAAALVPASVSGTTRKDYLLASGTSYRIGITTTTLSFVCYNLTVAPAIPITSKVPAATPALKTETTTRLVTDVIIASVYPNPHNGNFTLSIESPEEGVATVELYTVNGQKLSERKANFVKGKGNTVKYSNMKYALLFYKVRIGKHVATGKIISPN